MLPDRLLALTLAIQEAVIRRDWDEVKVLFTARGEILDAAPPLEGSKTGALLAADAELQELLQRERSVVLGQLKQSRKVVAAHRLYSQFG